MRDKYDRAVCATELTHRGNILSTLEGGAGARPAFEVLSISQEGGSPVETQSRDESPVGPSSSTSTEEGVGGANG